MQVDLCNNLAAWQRWRSQWDALAGACVFRSWDWLAVWRKHYLQPNQRNGSALRVLLAVDDEGFGEPRLVAALPCYLQSHSVKGRTLHLLGDGEACSDHLGMLCRRGREREAAQAFATHLSADGEWQLLQFEAVDNADLSTELLAEALIDRGACVERRAGQSCWSIDLPEDWNAFLAMQSKSHRKQLRQLETRVLRSSAASWRLVESPADFERGWDVLVDLHQRRRRSLGEPGCFSWPTWADFHRDVAWQLFTNGELRLSWLELHGEPIAAEYHFARGNTVFAYQGGLAPEAAASEPGRLSMIASLQHALASGAKRFDLLRGDEPYKAHWRAEPRRTHTLLAAPPRLGAQLRFRADRFFRRAVGTARSAARLLG